MTRFASSRSQALLLAAATFLFFGLAGEARAFTNQQRIACTPDALRLCSSHIPDISGITTCMRAQKGNLSVACKAVFDK